MKHLIAALVSFLLCVNASFALSTDDIPDEFQIVEHWLSLTTSFDIQTKTQKLGTLYRKFFSLMLTYEFFDPFDNKLATARAKFFSLTAHFDVYDHANVLLGSAEEPLFSFFPTFDIYSGDTVTRLAYASMNFWGTTLTVYDPITNKEIVNMHRSFFRFKNDWTFTVVDRPLLMKKNIDPRVLLTVVAFQGDREYWEKETDMKRRMSVMAANKHAVTPTQTVTVLKKIDLEVKQQGLNLDKVDTHALEAMANQLENDYKNTQRNASEHLTDQEQMNHFVDYCLTIVQSNGLTAQEKETILYLIKMRLQSQQL